MATATQILNRINLDIVSPKHIGKCHKAFELVDGKATAFYKVENEAGQTDDEGEVIEYKVTYDHEHGFRCSCESGQKGFVNCILGVCKHVIWSIAASREEHDAFAEIAKEQAATTATTKKPVTKAEAAFYRSEEKRQSNQRNAMLMLPSRQQ